MAQEVSLNYEIFNESPSKPLIYVLEIDGLPYVLGTAVVQQKLKYGAPGVKYGDPGIVYGGSIPYGGIVNGGPDPQKQRALLNVDSGLNLSQKSEPWEGKASVSQLSFVLTDLQQQALAIISPGVEMDEILLKKVRFYVGFEGISFPEDYVRMYKGIVSGVQTTPGQVTLKTADPNLIRRQKLFEKAQTYLSSGIDDTTTTIPVVSTDGFFRKVIRPGYEETDPEEGHEVGIKIGDEIILYSADPGATEFTGVTRGALGTTAAAHAADAEVTPVFYFEGNPLLVACKLMLSGWEGEESVTDVPVRSIVATGDPENPNVADCYVFGFDVRERYGLVEGDFITVSGTSEPRNSIIELPIRGFVDLAGVKNSGVIVQLEAAPAVEFDSTGIASFRSQFDVYPKGCGLEMYMEDVDVQRHVEIATQFLTSEVADFAFTETDEIDSGKEFIEKELYLPCAAFSLTRGGRCSVVLTSQPLPGVQLITIDKTNVIDPDKAIMGRAVDSRKFYNRVDFSYDRDPLEDKFDSFQKFIDSDSLNRIPYREYLQIESRGMRSDRNASSLIDRAVRKVFERYSFAAQTITFKCTWKIGALLEAGDVVLVDDQGDLNFPNLTTGQRGLGKQLWEILEKSTDMKTGVSQITMINGAGNLEDRFGLIAPSSLIEAGVSTSQFRLSSESFGALFRSREWKKWEDYFGLKVKIHDEDFTFEEEVTLVGQDDQDPFLFTVTPALSQMPENGWVLDLADYSPSADPDEQKLAKIIHAYLSPAVEVVAGVSETQFTVDLADAAKFWIGALVQVCDADQATHFQEVRVTNVVGNTITVETLSFVPDAGYLVLGIGFSADKSQSYRWYS